MTEKTTKFTEGSSQMDTEDKYLPTSQFKGNRWKLLQDNGWWIGTKLERSKANHDGTRDIIKIAYVTDFESTRLKQDGTLDVPTDDPRHGRFGAGRNIITFCEYPVGGAVTSFCLNCSDWRKVA